MVSASFNLQEGRCLEAYAGCESYRGLIPFPWISKTDSFLKESGSWLLRHFYVYSKSVFSEQFYFTKVG